VIDFATLRRGLNFTLTSKLGDIDLFGEITGGGGYASLEPHAISIELVAIREAAASSPLPHPLARAGS